MILSGSDHCGIGAQNSPLSLLVSGSCVSVLLGYELLYGHTVYIQTVYGAAYAVLFIELLLLVVGFITDAGPFIDLIHELLAGLYHLRGKSALLNYP